MPSLLIRLRQTTAQPTPAQFLRFQPGCWIQYFDDLPAKDPGKALSTCEFDPGLTRRKQARRCAVCFSLQAFRLSRTREGLLSFRNLGADVDLARVAGGIVGRLPEVYWELAAWGGLKEWNARNAAPLPDRELRAVYESIARRERVQRTGRGMRPSPAQPDPARSHPAHV